MGFTLKEVVSTTECVGKIASVLTKFTSVNNNYNKNETSFSKEELDAINSIKDPKVREELLEQYMKARVKFIEQNNELNMEESNAKNDISSSAYWSSLGKDIFKTAAIAAVTVAVGFMFKKLTEVAEEV